VRFDKFRIKSHTTLDKFLLQRRNRQLRGGNGALDLQRGRHPRSFPRYATRRQTAGDIPKIVGDGKAAPGHREIRHACGNDRPIRHCPYA